jgi:hypothetical protein
MNALIAVAILVCAGGCGTEEPAAAPPASPPQGTQGSVAQQPNDLTMTIALESTTAEYADFRLTILNSGTKPLIAVRYPWLYEVRVFDANNNKISDQAAIEATADQRGVLPDDWVVLRQGDAVSFVLPAWDAKGRLRLSRSVAYADCVVAPPDPGSDPPAYMMKLGARWKPPAAAPRIDVRAATTHAGESR